MNKNKDNSSILEYVNGSSTPFDDFKTLYNTKQIHNDRDKNINKIT